MADKAISELVAAQQITATDMFVLEQNGTAKKLTGQILLNWLTAAADGHGGIQSIDKLSTSGLADTYRITLADTTTFDFGVTNGKGVSSLKKTGTSGLVDTYTFTYNDGTTDTFTVTNGEKGDKGDNAYIWVKYASQEPTASSNSFGDLPDDWMGIYFGTASTAPTDWQQYKWYRIKGEKGDTGEPATIVSAEITYQASDSGTIIPSGSWNTSVPSVTPGRYLWTRQVLQFNTGAPITSYSVSRFGIDGTGAVSSVAGVAPDETGNVPLDASSVKALAITGGTMEGPINMNGKKLSGLNVPTTDDEPATKGYADNLKPDLTGYATENFVADTIADKTVNNFTTTEEGFVADARALKVLNDSKLSMELVWENDNPSSEFAPGNVLLSLDEGDMVTVVLRANTNSSNYTTISDIPVNGKSVCVFYTATTGAVQRRTVTATTDGVSFDNAGKITTSLATDNTLMIPVYIFRKKGVS